MNGIGKDGCNGKHSEFWVALFRWDMNRIGGDDLADLRYICKSLQPAARKYSMRAYHHDLPHAFFDQHATQFQNGSACGDLVIVYQSTLMSFDLIAHQPA